MKLRTRRQILFFLIILFVVIGGGVVAYSQGYRIDVSSLTIRKVGALFIRSNPSRANIYIDDNPKENQSWLLQNGTFINNLFPKKYRVSLTYPGFVDWHRTVRIEPSFVTEIKYAVLIPTQKTLIPTDKNVSAFFGSGDHIVTQDSDNHLWFRNLSIPGGLVHGSTMDGNFILTSDATKKTYFVTNFQTGTTNRINIAAIRSRTTTLKQDRIDSVMIDPTDPTNLIITTPRSFVLYNTDSDTSVAIDSIINPSVLSARPTNTFSLGVFAAHQDSFVWSVFDSSNKENSIKAYSKQTGERKNLITHLSGRTKKIDWDERNTLFILQQNGDLFSLAPNQTATELIAHDVLNFEISPDSQRIALIKRYSVDVVSFSSEEKSTTLPIDNASTIAAAVWYSDNHHLFLRYPDAVWFLDITDTNLESFTPVIKNASFHYDFKNNTLYQLENQQLFSIPFSS